MAVPEQVRKQTEAVQQLYADLEAPTSPENGEVAPEPVTLQEVPKADSVPEPAPTPTPIEQGNGEQEETFEQKYRTLQGMYNAEVPRLTATNQDLSNRLQSMEQLVASMNAAPAPVAEPAPAPASTLTEDEISEYGESIDIMRKVSQEVAGQYQGQMAAMQSTIDELRGNVVPRVEQIATQQVQNAEQVFWSELAKNVPNWRDINSNQDFQSWLLETDPLSGLTRQTYLDDAQRNLDVGRVGTFFTSWENSTGASVALNPDRSEQTSELERQVAPGKSRSNGNPQSPEVKTYTPQDISQFFDDVRTGKYAGKEDERNKTERDIFAAQAEGRIVPA